VSTVRSKFINAVYAISTVPFIFEYYTRAVSVADGISAVYRILSDCRSHWTTKPSRSILAFMSCRIMKKF